MEYEGYTKPENLNAIDLDWIELFLDRSVQSNKFHKKSKKKFNDI